MRTRAYLSQGLSALAVACALVGTGCQVPEDTQVVSGTGGFIVDPAPGSGTGGGPPAEADGGEADGVVAPPTDSAVVETASELPDASSGGSDADAPVISNPVDSGPPPPPPPPTYAGRPWNDSPQMIPGTIHCEQYDQGGEGVAYHDADGVNLGTVQMDLDPTLPEALFRTTEGVDLGATRPGRDRYVTGMDVQARQLYVGWTQPEEWVKYTVTVDHAGSYVISVLLSTLAENAQISISFDDGVTSGPRTLPWTRSYTAWRFADNIATVNLTAGTHVMTIRFETIGMVNLEYLTFVQT